MAEVGPSVLLLGNVKVGKSVLFARLTHGTPRDRRVQGTRMLASQARMAAGPLRRLLQSLRRLVGRGRDDVPAPTGDAGPAGLLVDAPGTSSLFASGEDEQVTRSLLISGGVERILFVADAKNLRRSLALFLQAAEFGLPMVLDLNMIDEAESLGISVDATRLAQSLSVDVNTSVASEGHGVARLPRLLAQARRPVTEVRFADAVEEALGELTRVLGGAPVAPRALALLMLSGHGDADALVAEQLDGATAVQARAIVERVRSTTRTSVEQIIAEAYYAAAETLVGESTRRDDSSPALLNRLGRWAEHPLLGIPIAMLVLAVGYLWIGELGATRVVEAIDRRLFQEWLLPAVEYLAEGLPWPLLRDALIDPDFGLVPTGLFLALGIVLPVLFFFYFFFAVLEDSGYLPRLSVLLDRALRKMGLNGKGVFPLVLGLSCVTMAIITTRMLETRKERLIASFLLLLGFPCAPLLAVMLIVLQPLHWSAGVTVFGFLLFQVIVAGVIANRLVPGRMPEFILELPPMRWPRPGMILVSTGRRTYLFLREALPVFLLASLVLFALDRLGSLAVLEEASRPLVDGLLGLPDQAVQVFIKTIIRRENGAAELSLVQGSFDGIQVVVTLIVMSLLTPCVNSAIVLVKERGLRIGLLMLVVALVYALLAGGLVNVVLRWLGANFDAA